MTFWPSVLVAAALTAANGVAASDAPRVPADVRAVAEGHGWRFTDARGMSLYVSDGDEVGVGVSKCVGDCAKRWPPLAVTATSDLPDWTTIARAEGRQWAYRGRPVYAHARDGYPGATFGVGEGWALAFQQIATPPGVTTAKSPIGQVLATSSGLTLYAPTAPAPCTERCLETWTPLAAPWAAAGIADFTVVDRGDGVAQWAFRGRALFTFAADVKAGDTRGHMASGPWAAIVLTPPPPVPGWVTVVGSDAGPLFADPNGMTLYAYDVDRNHLVYVRGEDCFDACIAEMWSPVAADATIDPIGNWSVVEAEGGARQWAYKGQPLYTSKLETRPGDLSGISQRRARAWRPIMYAVPSIQGASPNG